MKPNSPCSVVRPSHILLLLIVSASFAGCTHVQKPPIQVMTLAPVASEQKLPLKVALIMDAKWTNYTFSFGMMGDTFKYPLGDSLKEYARNVTTHSFQEVREYPDAAAAANTADVILQPSVAKMDHAAGMLAWQDRTLILLVEWTMRDAANKNTVWLTTIDGRAAHHAGNAFTGKGNERKLFQKLFDNITTNTVRAFKEAPEIKGLIKKP